MTQCHSLHPVTRVICGCAPPRSGFRVAQASASGFLMIGLSLCRTLPACCLALAVLPSWPAAQLVCPPRFRARPAARRACPAVAHAPLARLSCCPSGLPACPAVSLMPGWPACLVRLPCCRACPAARLPSQVICLLPLNEVTLSRLSR